MSGLLPATKRPKRLIPSVKSSREKSRQELKEIVPTIPKKPKCEAGLIDATRQHTGPTDILEWAGKVSGIDDDVPASFSPGDAEKILSITRYWIGSGGNTLPRLENWQAATRLWTLSPHLKIIDFGKKLKNFCRSKGAV
nr:hypothetical protein [uncultured Desulfobacter sp.]